MKRLTVYETAVYTHEVIVDDSITDDIIMKAEYNAYDFESFVSTLGSVVCDVNEEVDFDVTDIECSLVIDDVVESEDE